MPRDFASRGTGSKRKTTRKPARRRASPTPRTLFHGPSFSFGVIIGALVIIVAAYAPEFFEARSAQTNAQAGDTTGNEDNEAQGTQRPAVEFDFPQLLKESEVKPDPEPYAVEPLPHDAIPTDFQIQAASFRSQRDADQLRAELLLNDFPAQVQASSVAGETWFRVIVGPFQRKVEADRSMTRLRDRGLSAIWLTKHN